MTEHSSRNSGDPLNWFTNILLRLCSSIYHQEFLPVSVHFYPLATPQPQCHSLFTILYPPTTMENLAEGKDFSFHIEEVDILILWYDIKPFETQLERTNDFPEYIFYDGLHSRQGCLTMVIFWLAWSTITTIPSIVVPVEERSNDWTQERSCTLQSCTRTNAGRRWGT